MRNFTSVNDIFLFNFELNVFHAQQLSNKYSLITVLKKCLATDLLLGFHLAVNKLSMSNSIILAQNTISWLLVKVQANSSVKLLRIIWLYYQWRNITTIRLS